MQQRCLTGRAISAPGQILGRRGSGDGRARRAAGQPIGRVAVLLLAGAFGILGACREPRSRREPAPEVPPKPSPIRLLRPAAPGSFSQVIARIRPALVNLQALSPVSGGPAGLLPEPRSADAPLLAASPLRARVERSLGTGVIFNRQGHVLTAISVIRNATQVRARLSDGRVLPTELVGRDEETGVAVLRLVQPKGRRGKRSFTPAPLGASSLLRSGDWVVAVGDPYGTDPFVSAGLVSAPGASKAITLARPGAFSFIATDARISAANVGGPLLNVAGEVVGINLLLDARRRPMGFAVPIALVRPILPTLLAKGEVERAWLGIYVKGLTPEQAKGLGLAGPRGALVSEVVPGGPAAQAGIQAGDVILAFGASAISRHVELTYLATRAPVGKAVLVKLWRGGREHTLSLRPQRKPQ